MGRCQVLCQGRITICDAIKLGIMSEQTHPLCTSDESVGFEFLW